MIKSMVTLFATPRMKRNSGTSPPCLRPPVHLGARLLSATFFEALTAVG